MKYRVEMEFLEDSPCPGEKKLIGEFDLEPEDLAHLAEDMERIFNAPGFLKKESPSYEA